MSRFLAWNCANCTYRHDFPGPRCVMCGELRNATRQQMRDFIAGETMKRTDNDEVELVEPLGAMDTSSREIPAMHETSTGSARFIAMAKENWKQPATRRQSRLNPYCDGQGPKTSSTSTHGNTSLADSDSCEKVSTTVSHSSAPLHPPAPPRQAPTDKSNHHVPSSFPRQVRAPNSLELLQPPSTGNKSSKKGLLQNHTPLPVKSIPYSKGPVPFCPNSCKTWIYPQHSGYPPRQYQLEITETALQHNTLVSLPTGLGKTLIAAVVMYNYWRWFPTGKVIFLAPTLPLVNQQVHACYKIMGLPAEATAVLTGKLSREKRLEYWKQRRVFYCTPQTVQKDLVESDEFANRVVCLVLDEAHKATGDYAYVKVIEQLEAAGAKFRIVGLSATPGTSIKAIQQVVHALRSHCIEARHELDPSVQPYLHEKISEIVIVPRNDSQRQVERHLTNMLTPVLEQLRQWGAIRLNGNMTLTPFQIFQAKNDFAQRHHGQVPGNISSLYAVAHKLVEIRNDAHQSLGVVRTKLYRLRNEPQRGMLSTLVKSTKFQELIDLVQAATGGDLETSLSQQHGSSRRNNPKLTKLAELLQEHFCRADACGKSSRVIVFSQFRDSVAEIVLLLRTYEPSIRPHHFVGQGKPPKGSSNKNGGNDLDDDAIRLNGMKQSEQQKVIQEFRNDKYNVLVCTCIGEEGLDIGEVDLIVNYDTLRSPIRMIQRTGRTGRARDGRVVCLIAEGQEQRTFEQSKQAEKTLMRALEKKSNFVMHPDILLFPTPPKTREYMSMEIGSQLHLSQVAGAHSNATRKSNASKTSKFKLNTAQEQERQQRLGNLVILDTNVAPWRSVRRVLIRHRSQHQFYGGRSLRILRALEPFGPTYETTNNSSKVSRFNAAIHDFFPLDKPHVSHTVDKESSTPPVTAADDEPKPNNWEDKDETRSDDNQIKQVADDEPNANDCEENDQTRPDDNQIKTVADNEPEANNCEHTNETRPGDNQIKLHDVENLGLGWKAIDKEISELPRALCSSVDDGPHISSSMLCETVIPNHGVNVSNLDNKFGDLRSDLVYGIATTAAGVVGNTKTDQSIAELQFRLPTPPPSSSDDDSSVDEDTFMERADHIHNDDIAGFEHQRRTHVDPSSIVKCNTNKAQEASISFCLPTQSSSSEGENSSDEEETHQSRCWDQKATCFQGTSAEPSLKGDAIFRLNTPESESDDEDMPLISLKTPKRKLDVKKQKVRKTSKSSTSALKGKPEKSKPPTVVQNVASKSPLQVASENMKRKKRSRVLDDDPSQSNDGMEHQGQGNIDATCHASPESLTKATNHQDIQDTPSQESRGEAKQNQDGRNKQTRFAESTEVNMLTDTPLKHHTPTIRFQATPLNAATLNCQVCFSVESLDDDPLIICDCCELGFHKSCYAIEVNIESVEPWYCDLCKSQKEGDHESKSCLLCDVNSGCRKRHGLAWCHPICLPFVITNGSSPTQRRCFHCSREGGVRCFSCTATMHPYCAIHAKQQGCWTIVTVEPVEPGHETKAALFCPEHTSNANTFLSLHVNEGEQSPLPSVKLIQTRQVEKPRDEKPARLKRLKRIKANSVENESVTEQQQGGSTRANKLDRLERLKRIRLGASKFVLEEAEIGSDEDMDVDEEDELRQIEQDEMSNDSFINDSTELTQHFSQDALAHVDPDAAAAEVDFCYHRALDAQRVREHQFQTPILNRRMKKVEDSQLSSSSQRGLGNMHFIRSVLEHHRQGGQAEEIEEYFHRIEEGQGHSSTPSMPNSM